MPTASFFMTPSQRAAREQLERAKKNIERLNNQNISILLGNNGLLSELTKPYEKNTDILADALSPILYPLMFVLTPYILLIQLPRAIHSDRIAKKNEENRLDKSNFFINNAIKHPIACLLHALLSPLTLILIPFKIAKTISYRKELKHQKKEAEQKEKEQVEALQQKDQEAKKKYEARRAELRLECAERLQQLVAAKTSSTPVKQKIESPVTPSTPAGLSEAPTTPLLARASSSDSLPEQSEVRQSNVPRNESEVLGTATSVLTCVTYVPTSTRSCTGHVDLMQAHAIEHFGRLPKQGYIL